MTRFDDFLSGELEQLGDGDSSSVQSDDSKTRTEPSPVNYYSMPLLFTGLQEKKPPSNAAGGPDPMLREGEPKTESSLQLSQPSGGRESPDEWSHPLRTAQSMPQLNQDIASWITASVEKANILKKNQLKKNQPDIFNSFAR